MAPTSPDRKRYGSLAELREVARYEWGTRHAWRTRRAMLRGWWHWLVRRYATELCERCGCRVSHSIGESWWWAEGDLWLEVCGSRFGTLCPRCFTLAAREKSVNVHWLAVRS